jgi:anti-sigma factor (TIGR02949 family)
MTPLSQESGPSAVGEKKTHCDHQAECMKMIQMVLDGEATPEEIAQIKQNIGKCIPCDRGYHLEKSIKEALQLRLERRSLPANLVQAIQDKIHLV